MPRNTWCIDGRADAGLSRALTMTAIGLAIGLVLGAVFTRVYDRTGFHRIAAPVAPAASAPTNSKD